MDTITFECEVITPMFLAGADGTTPELRAPSIKGALRFWWRAMNGHLVGEDGDLTLLKEKEAELFGGSGKEDTKSKVSLRVVIDEDTFEYFNFTTDGATFSKHIQYLMYPFYHHATERDGIKKGVFKVIMTSYDRESLSVFANTFYLLSILGGLGTRSRRGMGSFKINKVIPENFPLDDLKMITEKDGKKSIRHFSTLTKAFNIPPLDKMLEFSNIQGATFYVKGLGTEVNFDSWEKAISDISFKMRSVRDNTIRKDIQFTQSDLNKKAAFGLPVGIRNENKDKLNLYLEDGEKEARRASPVYISIYKVGVKYFWITTFLKGQFMPEDSKIKFKYHEWDTIDRELVNEFITNLSEDETVRVYNFQ